MQHIAGGTFTMGSDRFYPEEGPSRRVKVDSFWIDAAPVTNREFAAFVEATGYVTLAEIAPDPADYPGMDPAWRILVRWCFSVPRCPYRSMIPANGGRSCSARTGAIRPGPTAASTIS